MQLPHIADHFEAVRHLWRRVETLETRLIPNTKLLAEKVNQIMATLDTLIAAEDRVEGLVRSILGEVRDLEAKLAAVPVPAAPVDLQPVQDRLAKLGDTLAAALPPVVAPAVDPAPVAPVAPAPAAPVAPAA
jgi:hypothetical protein